MGKIFLFFMALALAQDALAECDGGCCNTVLWANVSGPMSANVDLSAALNLKAPLDSPNFTGIIGTAMSANRAITTDSLGRLVASGVTNTVLSYLDVGAPLQGLLDLKANSDSPIFTTEVTFPVGAGVLLADSNGLLSSGSVNLATQVTGQLPAGNGGTGISSGTQNQVFATPNGSTGALALRKIVSADMNSGTAAPRSVLVADGSGNATYGSAYVAAGVYTGSANLRTYMYDAGIVGAGGYGELSIYDPTHGQWRISTNGTNNPLTISYGLSTALTIDPSPTIKTITLSGFKINEDYWVHFPSQRTLLAPGSTATKIFQAYTGDIWSFIIHLDCNVRLFDTDKLNWALYHREFTSYGNGTTDSASFVVPAGVAVVPDLYYNASTPTGSTFSAGNTNLTAYMCSYNAGNVWDWCIKIDNPSANNVMATVDCTYYSAHYN